MIDLMVIAYCPVAVPTNGVANEVEDPTIFIKFGQRYISSSNLDNCMVQKKQEKKKSMESKPQSEKHMESCASPL
jgi:hypothetical protein